MIGATTQPIGKTVEQKMPDFWDDWSEDNELEQKAAEDTSAEEADEENADDEDEVQDGGSDDADVDNEDVDSEVTAEAEDESEEDSDDEEVEEEDSEDLEVEVATSEKETMARPKATKAKAGGKSKAEWIREEIERRHKAGESLRPRDIVEALEEHGVAVVPPQVSVTLRDMGLRTERGGKAGKPAKAKPEKVGAKAEAEPSRAARKGLSRAEAEERVKKATGMGFSAAELSAAKELISRCGGLHRTTEILDVIARMQID